MIVPKIEIYKRNQGKYTRIATFVSVVAIAGIGALILGDKIYAASNNRYAQYSVPVVLTLVIAGVMFWVVNRPRTADFLIATESEMKKVSWSSKKEIIGSTKVVIITSIILSMVLLGVDFLFVALFQKLGLGVAG